MCWWFVFRVAEGSFGSDEGDCVSGCVRVASLTFSGMAIKSLLSFGLLEFGVEQHSKESREET